MKAKNIFLFLFIFLSACIEQEETFLGSEAERASGEPVAAEEFCQRVERVDPVQVRKHELPVHLQGYKDHCQSLVFTRSQEWRFDVSGYVCLLRWGQNGKAKNRAITEFLDEQNGAGFTEALRNEGDLDGKGSSQRLLFSVDENSAAEFFWTQTQLWSALSETVPDLESLSWRLGFQHNNSVVCSTQAKWEKQDEQILLRNVEKCYDNKVTLDTYTFGLSGKLLRLEQQTSDPPEPCS